MAVILLQLRMKSGLLNQCHSANIPLTALSIRKLNKITSVKWRGLQSISPNPANFIFWNLLFLEFQSPCNFSICCWLWDTPAVLQPKGLATKAWRTRKIKSGTLVLTSANVHSIFERIWTITTSFLRICLNGSTYVTRRISGTPLSRYILWLMRSLSLTIFKFSS